MQGSTSRHVSRPQASSSPRHKGYVTQTSEPQAHSQGARVAQKVERARRSSVKIVRSFTNMRTFTSEKQTVMPPSVPNQSLTSSLLDNGVEIKDEVQCIEDALDLLQWMLEQGQLQDAKILRTLSQFDRALQGLVGIGTEHRFQSTSGNTPVGVLDPIFQKRVGLAVRKNRVVYEGLKRLVLGILNQISKRTYKAAWKSWRRVVGLKKKKRVKSKLVGGRPKYKAATKVTDVPVVWTDALKSNMAANTKTSSSVGLLPSEKLVASRAYPLGSPALELNSLLRKLTMEGYGVGNLRKTNDPMQVKISASPTSYVKPRQIRARQNGLQGGESTDEETPFRLQRRRAMEEEVSIWIKKAKAK